MCCLKYEDIAYEDLIKKAPKSDAFVETPSGKGTVINVNLLRGNAKVRLEDGLDTTLKTFTFDELDVLGGKGRRAEYIAAKAEGKLTEAGFTVTPPPVIKPASVPPNQASRENQPVASTASASPARKPNNRYDRKPAPDAKKKTQPQAAERLPKDGEKAAKAPLAQPNSATPAKKPYFKRYKGGRGKNR